MLRNKGLAAAVLITACGLGILWKLSTSDERPGQSTRVEAAGPGGRAESGRTERMPAVDSAAAQADGRVEDRAKLEVPVLATASTESGAFEADAVYGRVHDPDGAGVAEATVLLFVGLHPLESQAAPLSETLTDENGRFRLRDLQAFESYQLFVEAEDFLPRLLFFTSGHDQETELERSVSVAGRVLDAESNEPLPGVEVRNNVRHWSEEGYQEYVTTLSDDEGLYRMPWARIEGMQGLQARRPGHAFEEREFQVDQRRTDGYDLRLAGGRSILLEVYDLDNGVVLANTEFELDRQQVTTDGTGRIDLVQVLHPKARDRRVNLSIGGDEWCRTRINFTLQEQGAAQLLRAPVTQGGKIRGRVVTSAGDPIPGALIRFGNKRNRFGNRAQKRPDLPENAWIGSRDEPVVSAPDGTFELVAIFPAPNPLVLMASHPLYADKNEENLRLDSAGDVLEVVLTLESGGVIQGRVTVDGEPKSTMVSWNSDTGNGWGRSNDRGQYRFRGVTPGEVKLNATLDDKSWSNDQSDPETVWVEEGEVLEHDLVLTSNRASIAGVVLDSTGDTVQNAEVIAWASGEGDFHFSTSTKTDEAGAFELLVEAVPGVLYELYARDGARHQAKSGVVPGVTGLELTLPELGELRLAVQDALTGAPIEGFSIYWRQQPEEAYQRLRQGSNSFSPGPDGSFVAQLAVGVVELRIAAKALGYVSAHVPEVRVEPSASDQAVPVLLERGVEVEVVFVYEAGTQGKLQQGLRRRRIALVSTDQRSLQSLGGEYFSREVRGAQSLRPDDSGVARVKGIAPGEYGMLYTPKGLAFEPETFEVPLVDQHRLEILVKEAKIELTPVEDP